MANERGWTSNASELLRYRILNWTAENPDERMHVRVIADALGAEPPAVVDGFALLKRDGLATDQPDARMSSVPAWEAKLTAEGRAKRDSFREWYNPRAVRLLACQDAVLDFLFEQDGSGSKHQASFEQDRRAFYFGKPFTSDDVREACLALTEYGLMTSVPSTAGVFAMEITPSGRECVLAGVGIRAWRNPPLPPSGPTFTFHGAASGVVVAVNSPNSTQTVKVTQDHRLQLVGLADAFEQMLPVLGLNENQTEQARTIIGELREIEPETEPGKVERLLQVAGDLAVGGVGNAAGTGLVALIQQIAQNWPF